MSEKEKKRVDGKPDEDSSTEEVQLLIDDGKPSPNQHGKQEIRRRKTTHQGKNDSDDDDHHDKKKNDDDDDDDDVNNDDDEDGEGKERGGGDRQRKRRETERGRKFSVSGPHGQMPTVDRQDPRATDGDFPVTVTFTVNLLAFVDATQSLECEGTFDFSYPDPGKPDQDGMEYADVRQRSPFDPMQLFLNCEGVGSSDGDCHFRRQAGVTYGHVVYKATFSDFFDFHRFPFDRQILSFRLSPARHIPGLRYVLNGTTETTSSWYGCSKAVHASFQASQFEIYAYRDQWGTPILAAEVCLERRAMYYFTQVALPLMLVVGLYPIAYAFGINRLDARMAVLLTLLLTSVAFKYVISQYLPKIPYLTYLDGYVLIMIGFLVITSAESAFVFLWASDEASQIFDWVFFGVITALFLMLHFFIAAFRYFGCMARDWNQVRLTALSREESHDVYLYLENQQTRELNFYPSRLARLPQPLLPTHSPSTK